MHSTQKDDVILHADPRNIWVIDDKYLGPQHYPLSDQEAEAFYTLQDKGKLYRTEIPKLVKYFHVKNFTACLVTYSDGFERLGIAKRNATDRPNRIRGEMISLVRAISL